jgi:ferredoxin-NADP reductase
MRAGHAEDELVLQVAARHEAARGVALLVLEHPDGRSLPEWEPGAHVDLILRDGLVRQYSLCGDPADTTRWSVAVLRDDQSRGGSAFVHEALVTGATVPVRGPRNHFQLEPADEYLFIAGGIGITPLLPMVEAVAARGAKWRLVYGGRTREAMAFTDEVVRRHGEHVAVLPEDEAGPLPVTTLLAGATGPVRIYCCGPESLLEAVEQAHDSTDGSTVHVERFSPKPVEDDLAPRAFEVEAARSGTVLQVGAQESVLDALRGAGLRVLASCEEGICGTCEVRVVAGTAEHRDSILTQEEQAAGDTMFVCVSRARSPRLVLDL